MDILIPKFKPNLNRIWGKVRETWVAKYMTHQAQALCALKFTEIYKGEKEYIGHSLAVGLFGRPLRGAGYAWQSKYPLPYDPSGTNPVDTTGANSLHMNCLDFCTVMEIGLVWQVAGTVTALVMDFDKYTAPNGAGTLTDKLDGTNGTITAPTVAGQAIGNVLYKNISDTLEIDLNKGHSIKANVTTTTTAGSGVPYVLVIPRDETMANLTTAKASS